MENQKNTFTIGEFGKRTTTTVRTLRYYEELGLLTPTKKNESGHRLYGSKDLGRLQKIQSLKFLGYSLQEIKNLIDNETEVSKQFETSLSWQHKLLTEKRKELNRAIEAVEYVQLLLHEEKPITWTVLSSLLFKMENEQDQIEWLKEYCLEDAVEQYSSLSKEQRYQMDIEMIDWLSTLKKVMSDGVNPQSPEAHNVAIKLSEIVMKHVNNKEDLVIQMQKAKVSMEPDIVNFKFPTIFTLEEEAYLEEVGKSIKETYEINRE